MSCGTTHFTAPEIQAVNFETFLRDINHENFAIATLLFMLFLPGKSPYSFKGGGNIKENILTNLERIKEKLNSIDEELKLKYYYVSDLLTDLEELGESSKKNKLDNQIVMRLELIMFVEIMENFNI